MLGGIVFQLVAIIAYVLLASEFLFRYYRDSPVRYSTTVTDEDGNKKKVMGEDGRIGRGERGEVDGRMKMMLVGMGVMTLCLFIRCVFLLYFEFYAMQRRCVRVAVVRYADGV